MIADFLQDDLGSHVMREAQESTCSQHRESHRAEAFGLTGRQNAADALPQSLVQKGERLKVCLLEILKSSHT